MKIEKNKLWKDMTIDFSVDTAINQWIQIGKVTGETMYLNSFITAFEGTSFGGTAPTVITIRSNQDERKLTLFSGTGYPGVALEAEISKFIPARILPRNTNLEIRFDQFVPATTNQIKLTYMYELHVGDTSF